MIVKVKEGYQVLSEKGKTWEGHTRHVKRPTRQVEFFKHHKPKAPAKQ